MIFLFYSASIGDNKTAAHCYEFKGLVFVSMEGDKLRTIDEAEEAAIESGAEEVSIEDDEGSKVFQVNRLPYDYTTRL